MKKALLSVAMILALASGAYAYTVAVQPVSLTLTPGQLFTVDALVYGAVAADAVDCVNFELYFAGQPIVEVGWNEGNFLAQQHPEMPWQFTTVDNALGIVSLTLLRLGPAVSTGSGTGATVTFQYTGTGGPATITYYLAVADHFGGYVDTSGEIIINETIIPEPMTLALVGVALTALGVVARRRS